MDDVKLQDRIVIEILSDHEVNNEFIAEQLRAIANEIEDCTSGGDESYEYVAGNNKTYYPEVLWEHECDCYHGFRIVSNESLIGKFYYHSTNNQKH